MTSLFSQIATVDGVGGVPTGDPRYPNSYATIAAALVDVKLPANDIPPGNTIRCIVAILNEGAGLMLDTLENLTLESNVPGGTHVRITPTGIGIGGGSCGMVIVLRTGKTITLDNLIITPNLGVAGPVDARAIQCYNAATDTNNATLDIKNCYFTAIRPTGHAQAGQPILNPLVHSASVDTIAERNAELRSFDSSGGVGIIELRANAVPTAGNVVTYNFTNTVVTHTILTGIANKASGIVLSRTRDWICNINQGCVFSFNSGAGIRCVGTMTAGTTTLNVNGTMSNPVFFYKNGWQEDVDNTGRNEGIQNAASAVYINYAYFVGNFQEGIDKTNDGTVTISNSYFANNQSDLDATNGTPPNALTAANLELTSIINGINITNCTIYDDLANNNTAPANDGSIQWTSTAGGGSTLALSNVVIAGAGDQVYLNAATGPSIYNETNVALVQAGPDSLESPYINVGENITANVLYRVTADPIFKSTVFAPTWNGLGVLPGNLTNYLAINTGAYNGNRESDASDVLGANPNGDIPITDWVLY